MSIFRKKGREIRAIAAAQIRHQNLVSQAESGAFDLSMEKKGSWIDLGDGWPTEVTGTMIETSWAAMNPHRVFAMKVGEKITRPDGYTFSVTKKMKEVAAEYLPPPPTTEETIDVIRQSVLYSPREEARTRALLEETKEQRFPWWQFKEGKPRQINGIGEIRLKSALPWIAIASLLLWGRRGR